MANVLAFPNPTFQPAMRIVTAITQANPASVTTSFAHQYVNGMIVRIDIPPGLGMQQMNQQFGPITVTGSTTFTIPIDSSLFDPLSTITIGSMDQYPQSVPFAELNGQLNAALINVFPGSVLMP